MSKTMERGRKTGPYTDLRDWLRAVEGMGELRRVEGATWEEDIGRITEMLHHTEESPTVLFDAIPGYPRGSRILVNPLGARRRLAFTLGMDPGISALRRHPTANPVGIRAARRAIRREGRA